MKEIIFWDGTQKTNFLQAIANPTRIDLNKTNKEKD